MLLKIHQRNDDPHINVVVNDGNHDIGEARAKKNRLKVLLLEEFGVHIDWNKVEWQEIDNERIAELIA